MTNDQILDLRKPFERVNCKKYRTITDIARFTLKPSLEQIKEIAEGLVVVKKEGNLWVVYQASHIRSRRKRLAKREAKREAIRRYY